MFYRGNETKNVRAYGKMLQAVYYGANLVWQAIRSCFGSGKWIDNKPWINEEKWKNN